MVRCGKSLEAYQTLANSITAFETLADLLLSDAAYAALTELIEEHRKQFPGDCRTFGYEGESLSHRGQWEDAERAFAEGQHVCVPADTEDFFNAQLMLTSRVRCLVMLDRSIEGCRVLGGDENVVMLFAEELIAADRVDQLKRFLEEFPVQDPSARRRWKAEIAFAGEDYQLVIPLLQTPASGFWRRVIAAIAQPLTESEQDKLIRSLIFAGDLEDAREQATQYRDANDDPIYIALCAAAAGNVAECSSLLLECVSDDGYHFATTVLADPHWKMYLGNDRFVALKQALEAQATIETTEYGLQLE